MNDFKQCLTHNSYSRQEEFTYADCDCHERARMSALVSKAAIFAGYDYDARGLTHEKLLAMREVFLLSRLAVAVHRCPRAGEVMDITTWEDGVKGPHMQRVYQMQGSEGQVRVSIRSDWILVDPQTRKILRPGTFTARPIGTCPVEISCPAPGKNAAPGEEAEDLGLRRIVWSDLDGNGHLFSGRYPDIIWDALPGALQDSPVGEFYLNYHKEATLGQELRLQGAWQENGSYVVEGTGPQGPCFTARIVFAH